MTHRGGSSRKKAAEDALFTWIVSDFGLNDAIESGLVKTPRVVVRDDSERTKELKSRLYHIYADDEVKECINIFDIRDRFEEDLKFDLVNCTEVAEHVDPKYLDIFLDNLKKMTGKYLILTWSSTYPPQDAPPQHISPLPTYDVEKLMNAWGFELDREKTDAFLRQSYSYKKFYFWWRESLTIWRLK